MTYTSTKYGLPAPLGSEAIQTIDNTAKALVDSLDDKLTPYSSGLIGARPTSTVGTPGIPGRFYRATDVGAAPGTLYVDLGTSWAAINDYEYAYSTWTPFGSEKTILIDGSGSATAGRIYPLAGNWQAAANDGANGYVGAAGCRFDNTFPLDTSQIAAGSRTTRMRIVGNFAAGIATLATFTVKLYRVTAVAGSHMPSINTVTAVAGSDWIVVGTNADGQWGATIYGGVFTAPATAGAYILGASFSGTIANPVDVLIATRLEYQQVP